MTYAIKYMIPVLMFVISAGIYVSLWISNRKSRNQVEDVLDMPVLQDQGHGK